MTQRTAANRYARALFDVALKERQDLDAIDRELSAFLDLVRRHPMFEKILLNPAIPAPRKRAAVAAVLAQVPKVSPAVGKLLVLLAERDRLVILPDLLAAFRDRVLDFQKVVRAEVVTAEPLSAERARAVEQGLAQLSGRNVLMEARVDPSLVGGVVARIGSTVYDASVVTQLKKMKQKLVESM
jgi:F-type H+-transporting ATPase subunit delta